MSPTRHLVIFARAPRMGRGKKRLGKDIGGLEALRFARRTLERTIRLLGGARGWKTWLALTPDEAVNDARSWPCVRARPIVLIPQGKGDLSRRMMRPMRHLPPGPTVLVGGDIPELSPRHILRAFAALGRHHLVFGPAADGGFWLFGQRRSPRILDPFKAKMQPVRWSSAQTLSDILGNLPEGWRWQLCDTLDDVDDGAAWRAWKRREKKRTQCPQDTCS